MAMSVRTVRHISNMRRRSVSDASVGASLNEVGGQTAYDEGFLSVEDFSRRLGSLNGCDVALNATLDRA